VTVATDSSSTAAIDVSGVDTPLSISGTTVSTTGGTFNDLALTAPGTTAVKITGGDQSVHVSGDVVLPGISFEIDSKTITVDAGVTVNTSATPTAGAITFKGATITIADGAQLLAEGPAADATRTSYGAIDLE